MFLLKENGDMKNNIMPLCFALNSASKHLKKYEMWVLDIRMISTFTKIKILGDVSKYSYMLWPTRSFSRSLYNQTNAKM